MCFALFNEALPTLDLWEKILNRKVRLIVCEDNQATIKIAKTGTTIGPGVMQGYVVKPGEVTKVELKPEPEKK